MSDIGKVIFTVLVLLIIRLMIEAYVQFGIWLVIVACIELGVIMWIGVRSSEGEK